MVFALPVSGSEFMQNFKLKFLAPQKRLSFAAGATVSLPGYQFFPEQQLG